MVFMKSDALVTRSGRPACSRVALALGRATSDSKIRPQVVPFGSSRIRNRAVQGYFERLLEEPGCQAAWDAFTDVTTPTAFPQQLSKGAAPLNGFRHYMIQDAIYLEYYVRVRMEAIGTWYSGVDTEKLWDFVTGIPSSLDYSTSVRNTCEYELGVPAEAIEKEWGERSQQLENSIRYYESVIAAAIELGAEGNSWLDIHFALLPCIKGYYTIAKALLQDPTTIRNTLYYPLWIQPNADGSYTAEYDAFIQDNVDANPPTPEQWARWGVIFKTACDHEREFFDLAIADTTYGEYDIVDAGNYTISPFVGDTTFLTYNGQTVTISGTSTTWELINSKEGYSVKFGEGQFLGVDSGLQVVINSDETTKWSINPVVIPDRNTYQLFLSGAIQLALNADGTTVTVENNNPTTQTWILTKAT